jgi:NADH-quinone oxidoreductase subunit M
MEIPYLLLQSVIIPVVAAPFLAVVGRKLKKNSGWVVSAILVYTTFLLILAAVNIWGANSRIEEEYAWSTSVLDLRFGLLADGLSLPVALVASLVCAACAAFSVPYMQHRIEQLYGEEARGMYSMYYSLFLLFPSGLVGVVLSTSLIELYLFVEMALVPAFLMIDLFGYADRHRIALMYFVWNHLGAALFLVGVVLAFSGNGSFQISDLGRISGTSVAFWACLLILVGWLIKMAVFGFHVWIRYAHGNTPTAIAPIIATIVGLGNYVLVRLFAEPHAPLRDTFTLFSLPLAVWAIVTMIYGALLTFSQDDIKLLYACSTISQTAYSLLGIATLTSLGVSGGIFYFLSHTLGKCILFLTAGAVFVQTGTRDMKEMGGLARKMPLTAVLCILGSMILSAIPPLSGFQAEWILFTGVFSYGLQNTLTLLLAVIGVLATFLSLVYSFWPAVRIFFGQLPQSMEKVKEAKLSMTIPLIIITSISLIIGLYPELLTRFLNSVL